MATSILTQDTLAGDGRKFGAVIPENTLALQDSDGLGEE